PTLEAIDPVRFISNRSSGKMGYAIAAAARDAGAEVTLITGPTALVPPTGVRTFPVESADDMKDAILAQLPRADVVIMAAAVADPRSAFGSDDDEVAFVSADGVERLPLLKKTEVARRLIEKLAERLAR